MIHRVLTRFREQEKRPVKLSHDDDGHHTWPQRKRIRLTDDDDSENQENSVKILNAVCARDSPQLPEVETDTDENPSLSKFLGLKQTHQSSADIPVENAKGESSSLLSSTPEEPLVLTSPYFPGDLLWVKIGKFSFWPSLVVTNVDGEYFRQKGKYVIFYVRFFGNVDSFAWTNGPKRAMEYAGVDKYRETVEVTIRNHSTKVQKELTKFYNIDGPRSQSQQKSFLAAIRKADEALPLSHEDRLKCFNPDASEKKKREKVKNSHEKSIGGEISILSKPKQRGNGLKRQTSARKRSSSPTLSLCSDGSPSQTKNGESVLKTNKKKTFSRKLEHGNLFDAVCSTCLNERSTSDLESCECGNSFHVECIAQPELSDDQQPLSCSQCQSNLCAICEKDVDGAVPIPATCCRRLYHVSCIRNMALVCKFSQDQQTIQECPRHVCLYCKGRGTLIHCVKCPVTYHREKSCVSASSRFLTANHILCLRHAPLPKKKTNLNHCFVCRKSGSLICCDICPAVVHAECASEDAGSLEKRQSWFCPDCVEGRFPVFGQICWGKIGMHPWWPVKILHPSELPEKCLSAPHEATDLAVFFFGCPDSQSYGWLTPSKVYSFASEDDGTHTTIKGSQKRQYFEKALSDARVAFKEFMSKLQAIHSKGKPPKFRKICTNKIVSASCRKKRLQDVDNCSCKPSSPCVDVTCTNRAVYVECSDDCFQEEKCQNRRFQQRNYKATKVFLTQDGRGWGLQAVETLHKDDFVIEYVGEVIDSPECDRRLTQLHAIGDPNVYFLEADANYIIDAGPAGNEARFINHSCEPNLRTEKWTVNGKLCVGLFAKRTIKPGEELTFNYKMQCRNVNENVCLCNASTCCGTLGSNRKSSKSPTP